MFLLDTNVVSAVRKQDPKAQAWIDRHESQGLSLSVVSIGEIISGIEKKRRRDPVAARHLEVWLSRLQHTYRDRLFEVDEQVALEWGRINALRTRGVPDGLIGATVVIHGLTLVTRNVAEFADIGIEIVDPWAG